MKKNITLPLLLCLSQLFLLSCQQEEGVHLRKKIIKKIYPNIVEVVIPKQEDDDITYERPLPFDQQDYKDRMDKYYAIGTAFFISPTRLISAAHVIPASEYSTYNTYSIRTGDGKVYAIDKIYRYSSYRDIIEFDLKEYPKNIQPLKLQEKVEIGDMVYAVGNAQGEGISTRGGQVSTFTPEPVAGAWDYIRFSSPASPGNSGGPLVNYKGEVVGVVVMKNQSENLNFALPVSQIKEVPTDKANFLERRLKVQDGNQVVVKDWKYQFPLPTNLSQLRDAAIPKLDQFYADLIEEFKETYKPLIFPHNPRFRESLLRQVPPKNIGVVEKDQALVQWNVDAVALKKITVDENNIIYYDKGDVFESYALFLLAPGETTAGLLKNPRLLLKRYLKAFGANRVMAGQRIAIEDPGEPNESFLWHDQLGRPWYTARWELLYNNSIINNHCTPTPEGVYCFMDHNGSHQKFGGYLHFVKENIIEMTVSYNGTLDQWIEFLAMDEELLPETFQNFSLKKKGDKLLVDAPEWKINFPVKLLASKNASIKITTGYDPRKELETEIEWFNIVVDKYSDFKLSLVKNYEAQKLSPDDYLEHWQKLSQKRGIYDGKVHILDMDQQLNLHLGKTFKETILTGLKEEPTKKIDALWVLRCQAQASLPKKEFTTPCISLKKSITIK